MASALPGCCAMNIFLACTLACVTTLVVSHVTGRISDEIIRDVVRAIYSAGVFIFLVWASGVKIATPDHWLGPQ
jgi:hypothetical protein